MFLSEHLQELLLLPPVEWSGFFHKHHQALDEDYDLKEVIKEAEALGQKVVLLQGYLDSRLQGQNHDKAVKRANNKLNTVRRTFGFTNPKGAYVQF